MKITILDRSTVTNGDISLKEIEALGETQSFDIVPHNFLADYIGNSEAVICNKAVLSADVLEKCLNLKYIGLFATGYNNIDLDYANKAGITVCNVPGYSTDSVAQMTFALILQLATNVSKYTSSVSAGDWIASKQFTYFPYPITELSNKTLGIYGFGTIGKAVAKIASAFNMNILVCRRTPIAHSECEYEFVTPDELFKRSDFITVHCPLNEDSREIISKRTLSLMKSTSYFINTARGGCVNEVDLAYALNNGHIAGAAIDVLSIEPMIENNPLLSAKNCYITPHIAWASYESRLRLISRVAENLKAFIDNNPINKVTQKECMRKYDLS